MRYKIIIAEAEVKVKTWGEIKTLAIRTKQQDMIYAPDTHNIHRLYLFINLIKYDSTNS